MYFIAFYCILIAIVSVFIFNGSILWSFIWVLFSLDLKVWTSSMSDNRFPNTRLFHVIINNINNVYKDNNENNYIIQIIIIMITFIHSLTRPLKMILFWTTSVSPKLYKHDYMTIIILCIHCWSIHFFLLGYSMSLR